MVCRICKKVEQDEWVEINDTRTGRKTGYCLECFKKCDFRQAWKQGRVTITKFGPPVKRWYPDWGDEDHAAIEAQYHFLDRQKKEAERRAAEQAAHTTEGSAQK